MAEEANGEFHDFYKYTPSLPAAITFITLFLVSTCLHIHQLLKHRAWFLIALVTGGIFEVVGYAGRICSNTEAPLFTDTPYIIQSLFLLLGPALMAASVYMLLGRLVLLLGADKHLLFRRTWMTKIFVMADILSFAVQGIGGGLMSNGKGSNLSLGEDVLLAGLAVQIVALGVFIAILMLFHLRMRRHDRADCTQAEVGGFPWRKHLFTTFSAAALILARSIFRFIEYLQGSEGALLRQEVYLYCFDAVPMLATMMLFNWQQPGTISPLLRMDADGQGNPPRSESNIGLTKVAGAPILSDDSEPRTL